MAKDFVRNYGITHTLLWDKSFDSWRHLGVTRQPAAKLYSADGRLLGQWQGPFNEAEVLKLIAA